MATYGAQRGKGDYYRRQPKRATHAGVPFRAPLCGTAASTPEADHRGVQPAPTCKRCLSILGYTNPKWVPMSVQQHGDYQIYRRENSDVTIGRDAWLLLRRWDDGKMRIIARDAPQGWLHDAVAILRELFPKADMLATPADAALLFPEA